MKKKRASSVSCDCTQRARVRVDFFATAPTNMLSAIRLLARVLGIRGRDGGEALGNEFSLLLASLGRLRLLQDLPATGAAASGRLELAHVFAVSLTLLLLGVGAARKERLRHESLGAKGQARGKRLQEEQRCQ